jgi:hypothetical protein
MKPKDAIQKALRQVEAATESGKVKGEDLLRSPHLKKQLREAKKRIAKRPSKS